MNLTQQQIKALLWERGDLTWKLDQFQKELYNTVLNTKEKISVVLCSRRLGKSYAVLVMAMMLCLQKPKTIVKILAPTKDQIDDITGDLIPQIIADCPEELRPVPHKSKFTYNFLNGSKIQLAGADSGHSNKLRGGFAHLCIVDEAGFCNDLTTTIRRVLIPTTMNTRGKILLVSTPPDDPDHEFIDFINEAEEQKTLIKKTIYDNPRIKKEEIDDIIKSYPGGAEHPDFRREYLCHLIKDPKRSVLPEFDGVLESKIVKENVRPPFFDSYVAMDLGGRDLTVALFAYYDFRKNKIVIEDEVVVDFKKPNESIPKLTKAIEDKIKQYWFDPITNQERPVYKYISDINYIVTNEIRQCSNGKINFLIPKKEDKEAAVLYLKTLLLNDSIIINPRCKTLIRHCKNAKWKRSQGERIFDRSPDDGHYDALDALIYLVRSVDFNRNPYPAFYDYNLKDLYVNNPDKFKTQDKHKLLVSMFKGIGKR